MGLSRFFPFSHHIPAILPTGPGHLCVLPAAHCQCLHSTSHVTTNKSGSHKGWASACAASCTPRETAGHSGMKLCLYLPPSDTQHSPTYSTLLPQSQSAHTGLPCGQPWADKLLLEFCLICHRAELRTRLRL